MSEYGIGYTPLCELASINSNRLFLKMESKNFLGSVKARTGYALVSGLIVSRDCIIVESTSGNLGLALDYFCKEAGRPFLCLLDETVVPAKLNYLKSRSINCEVVPTEHGLDGRASRMKRAEALTSAGTHFWVNQYDNEKGVVVHQKTTGPEINEQTCGTVTSIFCAVGSGGTISGIGEYFKSNGNRVKMIGVEPYGSTIFHTDDIPYITAGAGLRGKPGNINRHGNVISFSYAIHDEESINKCRMLNNVYKVDVGLTTGMVYAAAEQFCATTHDETIVLVAADGVGFYHDYL
jgi:cysteine synthase A